MHADRPGLSRETLTGLILGLTAMAGVLAENIDALRPFYDQFLDTIVSVTINGTGIEKPLLLWINDGLMAVFFLYVALEIKKEVMGGALSSWRTASLPVYGAVGGIAVPALVFLGIVGVDSAQAQGWAIPAATDIAFAIAVLSLFGDRVPPAMRVFLLALAIVDDLAAIVIIAAFYTSSLSLSALAMAGFALAVLAGLNWAGVRSIALYVIVGLVLWVCVLKSGVHATLAGVALGFAIPMTPDARGVSPLKSMVHGLEPWIGFLVMPLFAFANAGVPLGGVTMATLTDPLTLGVAAGLFIGKQIGVFGCAWLAIRTGIARMPEGAGLAHLYGVALLAGIGFTMSLFIGTLAFDQMAEQNAVRLGVLAGSILSGVVGSAVLLLAGRPAGAAIPRPA